ncbi:MAG: EamA family transporter [Acidobacteria bacterium]|nr:EamA family transporter [Acidobacteriota bacterium]
MTPALAYQLAAAAAIGWALYDVARRALASHLTAWALVAATTVAALPVLVGWAVVAGDWRLQAGYWIPGLASVALNVAANFGYFRAFQMAPMSVTLPMLSFTPLFATLLGALFLGESIGPREAAGALLVVIGGLLLGLRAGGLRFEPGSAVMLGVAFLWSATLLLDKRALALASPSFHALVLYAGVAVGGVVALVVGNRLADLRAVRGHWLALVAAVAVGVLALALQLFALRELPVGVVETMKRGVGGLSAVLLGRLLYAEAVTLRKLGAILAMTVGVALILL